MIDPQIVHVVTGEQQIASFGKGKNLRAKVPKVQFCFFFITFQAMASSEDRAYEIMRELDVSYVLVIFGGLTGYASDGKSSVKQLQMLAILALFPRH